MSLKEAKQTYVNAKAKMEVLKDNLEKLNAPVYKALDEQKITEDEWADLLWDNEEKLGFRAARDALVKAEDNLLSWGLQTLVDSFGEKKVLEVTPLFKSKRLKIRKQVIELTMGLN